MCVILNSSGDVQSFSVQTQIEKKRNKNRGRNKDWYIDRSKDRND